MNDDVCINHWSVISIICNIVSLVNNTYNQNWNKNFNLFFLSSKFEVNTQTINDWQLIIIIIMYISNYFNDLLYRIICLQ